MKNQIMDVDVVVLGASPTGLYVVRELTRAGYRVALADTQRGCANDSRSVPRALQAWGSIDDISRWLDNIAAQSSHKPVLFPTNDVFIEYIIEHHVRLGRLFRFSRAYEGVAEDLLDKGRFHALCVRHGMATPGVWRVPGIDALRDLATELPFPCILKPLLIHQVRHYLKGKKVLLARTPQEYLSTLSEIADVKGEWLVQEVIPGAESSITLFGAHVDHNGLFHQAFTGRKLRQYPPGFGSASLVTSESCPETHELSMDFLSAIGFAGTCGVEFKRDPRDQRLKIIEINPRPTLWFQLTHDAGKRIAASQVAELLDRPFPPEESQHEHTRWRYGLKDMYSQLFYMRNKGSFVFPPPETASANTASRRSWPVYEAGDPAPALLEPLRYAKKLWRRR